MKNRNNNNGKKLSWKYSSEYSETEDVTQVLPELIFWSVEFCRASEKGIQEMLGSLS